MHVIAIYEHEVRRDEGTFSKVDKCEINNDVIQGATTKFRWLETRIEIRDRRNLRVSYECWSRTGVSSKCRTACTYVGKAEQAHLIPNETEDGRYPGARR